MSLSQDSEQRAGDTFLEDSHSPSLSGIYSPDDVSDCTPPIPPRSLDRKPTPRPQLFPSFEEAHSHVVRRNVSDEFQQSQDEDMFVDTASSSPMLCAVPPNSPVLDSSDTFVIWEDVPEPLNTPRDTSSSTQPPSQVSGSSVGQIIAQYGNPSSSVPQSENDLDLFIGQNAAAVRANDSASVQANTNSPIVPWGQRAQLHGATSRPGTPFPHYGCSDSSETDNLGAPQVQLPAIPPFHPTNPFAPRRHTSAVNTASSRTTETSVSDAILQGSEDQEYVLAEFGSELRSRTDSEDTPSDAESKVDQLIAPPTRMHSARRQQRGRRSVVNRNTNSLRGAAMTEESDEDPFQYDRPNMFLQPSKEREVSACLRQVSGLARESTATVYSQDGTPSKSYYGGQYFINNQPVSPASKRVLDELAHLQAPSDNPSDQPKRMKQAQYHASPGIGAKFYDQDALKSEWAVGSPDVVKVPVNQKLKAKENRFGGAWQNQGQAAQFQSENEMRWAALRRDEAQANRMTGNTED